MFSRGIPPIGIQGAAYHDPASSSTANQLSLSGASLPDEVSRIRELNYIPPGFTLGERKIRVGSLSGPLSREQRRHLAHVLHNIGMIVSEPSSLNSDEDEAHDRKRVRPDPSVPPQTDGGDTIQSYIGRYLTTAGKPADALVSVETDSKGNLLGIATLDVNTNTPLVTARFKPAARLTNEEIIQKFGTKWRQAAAEPVHLTMLSRGSQWKKNLGVGNEIGLTPSDETLKLIHALLYGPQTRLLPHERVFLQKSLERWAQAHPDRVEELKRGDLNAVRDFRIDTDVWGSLDEELLEDDAFLMYLIAKHLPIPQINDLKDEHLKTLHRLFFTETLLNHEKKFLNSMRHRWGKDFPNEQKMSDGGLVKLKKLLAKEAPASLEFLQKLLVKYYPVPHMHALSEHNLKLLRSCLMGEGQALRQYELDFLNRMQKTTFFISHATPADLRQPDGSVALYSRIELLKRGVEFSFDHTEGEDIYYLQNSDNVFFSLECGDKQRKPSSRFGQHLMRFRFDLPAVQANATLSLVNPLLYEVPQSVARLKSIEDFRGKTDDNGEPYDVDEIIERVTEREFRCEDSIFHGNHMLTGLGLAVIDTCRECMPTAMAEMLLQKEDMNDIVNTLFRPEIMVPKHFFATPHDEAKITLYDVNADS